MRHETTAVLLVTVVLALTACGPHQAAPRLAPRSVSEKTWHGQGYKQIEEGLTVVHLKGDEAEMAGQEAALLGREREAFTEVIRRNRVLQEITRGGCTNFAAFGPATVEGKIWHGRTFDFYGLGAMDRYKVVYIVEPAGGIPYVTIGWPGWGDHAWVHTAMNAAGLSLGYMWANSADERIGAAPRVWTLLHQVIAQARTLDQAVEIIRRGPRASAANVLITDAKIPDAVVVELTSRQVAVRPAEAGTVHATNHFMAPSMREPIKDPNSAARYARLEELLQANAGQIDLQRAAAFLRDRFDARLRRESLSGDVIAWTLGVLAVIFSPSDLTFWIARGLAPAAYSDYVGFSLKEELAGTQDQTRLPAIAGDPVLRTPAYQVLMTYQAGYVAFLEGRYAEAIEKLREALTAEPQNGRYLYSLARAYMSAGRQAEALDAFRAVLATDVNEVLRAYSHFWMGRIYEERGDTDRMRAAFEQVLALATGDPEIEDHAKQALAGPR